MKIIGIVSTKGGIGKSQMSLNLAVLFNQGKGLAGIIDTDGQQSCLKWSMRRVADSPSVVPADIDSLDGVIDVARQSGIKFLFIDTPPKRLDPLLSAVVERSDLVVTVARPEPLYIDGVVDTWPEIKDAKRAICVLNAIPTDTSSDGNDLEEFVADNLPDLPVAKVRLHYRKQFWQPLVQGQTVTELPNNMKNMKAQGEALALYKAIKKELA